MLIVHLYKDSQSLFLPSSTTFNTPVTTKMGIHKTVDSKLQLSVQIIPPLRKCQKTILLQHITCICINLHEWLQEKSRHHLSCGKYLLSPTGTKVHF